MSLSDAQLIAQLVTRAASAGERAPLEAELALRAQNPARRAALRRLLEGYALGADEYLGDDAQAAARHYLAMLSG